MCYTDGLPWLTEPLAAAQPCCQKGFWKAKCAQPWIPILGRATQMHEDQHSPDPLLPLAPLTVVPQQPGDVAPPTAPLKQLNELPKVM